MKLALLVCASVVCTGLVRAGDESLLPLRTWSASIFVVKVAGADLDGNGRKDVITVGSDEPFQHLDAFSLGPHGDLLSQTTQLAPDLGDAAAADFDGDGYEDVAFAGKSVFVYRGGPSGVPALWKSFVVSSFSLVSVVSADFDGDTWPDILVSEGLAGTSKPFRILRNTSGQGFVLLDALQAPGMVPGEMALADLNADGTLDVLASERTTDLVRVLLGQPGGLGFANLSTLAVADQPQDIRALDLTGDGLTDFAVAVGGTASGVTCRAGTGGGGFGPALSTPAAGSWGVLDSGDIDGDGDEDLVLGSNGFYTYAYRNTGALPLAAPQSLRTMHEAPHALMTDANGDGWEDLVAGPASAPSMTLVFGGPQGLQSPTVSTLTVDQLSLHAADFTGDGQPDLLTLGGSGSRLTLSDGHGDGSFGAPVSTNLPGSQTGRQSTIGLCSADALLDAVVLSTLNGGSHLRLARGNGAAKTFTLLGQASVAVPPAAGPLAADLDGDGAVEICLPVTGAVHVWHVDAADGLVFVDDLAVPGINPLAPAWERTTAGDLDEDGFLDIVFPVVTNQKIFVLPGQAGGGLGSFTSLNDDANTFVNCVFAVDVDEDGLKDLVGTGQQLTTTVWLGGPGMAFGPPQTTGNGPRISECADVDADGHLDIVGLAPQSFGPEHLLVRRGRGDGSFQPALRFASIGSRLAVADFSSDGVPDVAATGDFLAAGSTQDGDDPWLYVSRPYTEFTNLGHGLAGSEGVPEFLAWAWLKPGQVGQLSVTRAAPLAPAILVVGLGQALLPLKGGTLVPSPDVVLPGFATDAQGRLHLAMPWPPGVPAGLDVVMQWWIADTVGPSNFAASDALTAVTP